MKKAKVFAVGAALLIGMSSAALAKQRRMGDQIIHNAARSGGGGTHHTGIRTGSESNTEKIFDNHNGYQRQ
jgi:hypothetical protein